MEVAIAGTVTKWDAAAFAKAPHFVGKNTGGADRDMWSLRELAHTLVGPTARVSAVTGGGATKSIDETAWNDASRTPVLQTTRRGAFKFRWTDTDGKWGEAEIKDVSRLEIVQ
jgi:hypothetical protein